MGLGKFLLVLMMSVLLNLRGRQLHLQNRLLKLKVVVSVGQQRGLSAVEVVAQRVIARKSAKNLITVTTARIAMQFISWKNLRKTSYINPFQ